MLFFYRSPTGNLYAVCLCNFKTRVKDDGTLQPHSNQTGYWCEYSGAPVDELPQQNSEVKDA